MWGKIFECMIVKLWLKKTFAIILDNTTVGDKGFSKQDKFLRIKRVEILCEVKYLSAW
jgi:hypothetical protein